MDNEFIQFCFSGLECSICVRSVNALVVQPYKCQYYHAPYCPRSSWEPATSEFPDEQNFLDLPPLVFQSSGGAISCMHSDRSGGPLLASCMVTGFQSESPFPWAVSPPWHYSGSTYETRCRANFPHKNPSAAARYGDGISVFSHPTVPTGESVHQIRHIPENAAIAESRPTVLQRRSRRDPRPWNRLMISRNTVQQEGPLMMRANATAIDKSYGGCVVE